MNEAATRRGVAARCSSAGSRPRAMSRSLTARSAAGASTVVSAPTTGRRPSWGISSGWSTGPATGSRWRRDVPCLSVGAGNAEWVEPVSVLVTGLSPSLTDNRIYDRRKALFRQYSSLLEGWRNGSGAPRAHRCVIALRRVRCTGARHRCIGRTGALILVLLCAVTARCHQLRRGRLGIRCRHHVAKFHLDKLVDDGSSSASFAARRGEGNRTQVDRPSSTVGRLDSWP